jgi:hypothetical protein
VEAPDLAMGGLAAEGGDVRRWKGWRRDVEGGAAVGLPFSGSLLVAATTCERVMMVARGGVERGCPGRPELPVGGARGKGELPVADISTEDEAGYPTFFGPVKPMADVNLLSTPPPNNHLA